MRIMVAVVAISAGLLAACRTSPAPHYYTLDMAPSGKIAPSCDIEVDRLRAVEPLERPEILVKHSPTEIQYYALDQWASNPGQLAAEKLQAEFGHHPNAAKHVTIDGRVLAFEQVDSPTGPRACIKLDLEFRTRRTDRFDRPTMRKTYEWTGPVSGQGADAVARALSTGMVHIAAEVAADADRL